VTRKRIVWSVPWLNADPDYWHKKDDSFQDALAALAVDHDVHVCTLHPTRRDIEIIRGVYYHFLAAPREGDVIPWGDWVGTVRRLDPDVIHYWGFSCPASRSLDYFLPDVPKTVYPVGSRIISAAELAVVRTVFVTTPEDAATLKERPCYRALGPGAPDVVVCPFTPTETFQAKTYRGEVFDVIHVADWRPLKRHDLLIEAVRDTPWKAVLIGNRHDPAYHERCRPVTFSGHSNHGAIYTSDRCSPAHLASLYHDTKVAVQLSSSEGGSRVVTEAMACGLPLIVCSDCRSNADRIEDGVTGFVVDPTPKAIRRKIAELLVDAPLREKIGRNAARHARSLPSMTDVFRHTTEALL